MTIPSHSKFIKDMHPAITITSDELQAIFDDQDIVKLEYPADEFPTSETRIIIIFSQQSGKKPQYIELQEWLDLLENYRERQEAHLLSSHQPAKNAVCVISFRINGDDKYIGKMIVLPEERNNCVNAILQKYPYDHLEFSIELISEPNFEETFVDEFTTEEVGFNNYAGSRTIH
mgnify:CR=1 FL=1